jgi:FtsZ-interacting cell division protein ZipA
MPEISKILIVYGPLGILALLAIYVAIRLYRDREADRKAFASELKAEHEKHASELKAERDKCDRERLERAKEYAELEERMIQKSEVYTEKYHQLSNELRQLLESLTKRRGG